MDRFWWSVRHLTSFHATMCLLGFCWYASPVRGSDPKTTKNETLISIFKSNSQNIKKNLHRTAPSIPTEFCTVIKTAIWQSLSQEMGDCHFENRKIAISWQWFDRSPRILARWRTLALRTLPDVKISNFWRSKMVGHCNFTTELIPIF